MASYLLGSIPTALIAARLAGRPDPRTVGTGNAGATNVALSVHPLAGLAVFLVDVAKGYLAGAAGSGIGGPELGAVCALAAVTGQVAPVFAGFRGGKGVATTFGGYIGIHPVLALSAIAIWTLATLVVVRRFVPGTVVSLLLLVVAAGVVASPPILGYAVGVAVIGIVVHRHDLAAWRRGEIPTVRQALRDNRRRT
ncbi:MAG TPA: glycerol-3-phosphate acyltransferase [Candidatus Saccharimonadales bacterium]|nr:glycerol-3-phosphate acyltransferase [Candidatus Saccharimonadales bacterium]